MDENFELITVEKLNTMVYEVRGKQVMLDFELAELYGYTTTRFNEQVKHNKEKFDEEFMFELTKEEFENLMSKKSTSSWGGRRKLPKVFTEEGVYMLISVLKGELATNQHKALIKAFKAMKDYIIQTQGLVTRNEHNLLTSQVMMNTEKIDNIASSIEMLNHNLLIEDNLKEWTFLQGQRFEANEAYIHIFSQAKQTIYYFDDFPSIKTLSLLAHKPDNVNVVLFTDNKANNSEKLRALEVENFNSEYSTLNVKPNNGKVHDRYVLLDYGTDDEKIYLCGSSSKDAGNKMSSISILNDFPKFYAELAAMLVQPDLVLP